MIHLTSSKSHKSALVAALDYLSRRALTHYELETRLIEKGYDSLEVLEVLERIEELGYLNDQQLALTVSKNRLKRSSRQRVVKYMQNRGFEPQLIEQALKATYSIEDESQQCLTLAKRLWATESRRWDQRAHQDKIRKSLPRELALEQKVARKLIQRGYPINMVMNVLYQIQKVNNFSDETIDPNI
ncbi:MAG: regulatory protein RecX [Desulfosporosinus sp.]